MVIDFHCIRLKLLSRTELRVKQTLPFLAVEKTLTSFLSVDFFPFKNDILWDRQTLSLLVQKCKGFKCSIMSKRFKKTLSLLHTL